MRGRPYLNPSKSFGKMETKKSFKLKKKHNNNRNEIMCKKGRWLTIRKVLSSYEN